MWRTQLQRSVRSPCVVVRGIHGKRLAEMSLSEDQHAVGELGADSQHEAFGIAVRARAPRRILTTSKPASTSTASNEPANCPARSRTRNRKGVMCSPRSHDEVAG